jgi:alginate O-acetyltransferase complex protein AlgI
VAILQAMVGMKGIVLPNDYQTALPWLGEMGVQFKPFAELVYLPQNYERSLTFLCALLIGVIFLPNTQQIAKQFRPNWLWAFGLSGVALGCLLSLNRVSEFLYFQF